MPLWMIKQIDDPYMNEFRWFVVRADTEENARNIAQRTAELESLEDADRWLFADSTRIDQLTAEGPPGVILSELATRDPADAAPNSTTSGDVKMPWYSDRVKFWTWAWRGFLALAVLVSMLPWRDGADRGALHLLLGLAVLSLAVRDVLAALGRRRDP